MQFSGFIFLARSWTLEHLYPKRLYVPFQSSSGASRTPWMYSVISYLRIPFNCSLDARPKHECMIGSFFCISRCVYLYSMNVVGVSFCFVLFYSCFMFHFCIFICCICQCLNIVDVATRNLPCLPCVLHVAYTPLAALTS